MICRFGNTALNVLRYHLDIPFSFDYINHELLFELLSSRSYGPIVLMFNLKTVASNHILDSMNVMRRLATPKHD